MAPETIAQSGELRISLLILTVVAFFIYFVGPRDRSTSVPRVKLGKNRAYLLLSLYVAYVVYVVGRGADAAWTHPITAFLHRLLEGLPSFT